MSKISESQRSSTFDRSKKLRGIIIVGVLFMIICLIYSWNPCQSSRTPCNCSTRGKDGLLETNNRLQKFKHWDYKTFISNETSIMSIDDIPKDCTNGNHALLSRFRGRYGNHLFQLACMLGIASRQKMVPVLPNRSVFRVFNLTSLKLPESCRGQRMWAFEATGIINRRFNPMTEMFGSVSKRLDVNIVIKTHLLSWKYFSHIENSLRKKFNFIPSVQHKAKKFLEEKIPEKYKESNITYVGVHIRLTDRTSHWQNKVEYLQKATKYYNQKYANVVFVVCSDNIRWSQDNFPDKNVVFSVDYQSEPWVDLAILSMCNHTITTVGTFSWWAGWLAGGEVVYYERRKMKKRPHTSDDFFPPHWIKMN